MAATVWEAWNSLSGIAACSAGLEGGPGDSESITYGAAEGPSQGQHPRPGSAQHTQADLREDREGPGRRAAGGTAVRSCLATSAVS